MAKYDSMTTEEPGQYPTTAWHLMGLPEQNFGSGAAGSQAPSKNLDPGGTNQPGQYPDRDDFTGVSYAGFQPDGSGGVGFPATPFDKTGSDTVAFDEPTFYKDMAAAGDEYDDDGAGQQKGYRQATVQADIQQWTEANAAGYLAPDSLQMPGVAGNTPVPGSNQYQTDGQDGSGHVMWGGFRRGQRPATAKHPTVSGPGT